MKVSELSGSTLDWAVAESLGWEKTIGKTDEGRKSAVLVDVKGVWRKFDATELAKDLESDPEVSLRCLVSERLGDEVQIPSVLVDEYPTRKPSGMGL